MIKTKTITLGGQSYEVGPFVIGQVEIITPILWRFIKVMRGAGGTEMQLPTDPVALFMSIEIPSDLLRDMTVAIAAALPAHPDDYTEQAKRGKRWSADELRATEASFLDMLTAMLAILPLAGFGGTPEEGDAAAGEIQAGTATPT